MKTAAIVQARMSSTRLPGKVLFPLGNTTVLGQLIARLKQSQQLGGVIIAVPESPKDEPLVREAANLGVECFRGDEHDLLDRFYAAATEFGLETIVRITSDCPFFDPYVLDEMLVHFAAANEPETTIDYSTNCTLKRTYPRGLDAEVFTFEALERTFNEAQQPLEREHVTPYMYTNPDRFRLDSHENETDLSHHRWVVDTAEDWRFIYRVHELLNRPDRPFTTAELLELLEREPELAGMNAEVTQKNADNRFAHGNE
tara:strand:- start:1287 stop:2057 length:771 start_codon:yes stop_codon:yes gene_type:complete